MKKFPSTRPFIMVVSFMFSMLLLQNCTKEAVNTALTPTTTEQLITTDLGNDLEYLATDKERATDRSHGTYYFNTLNKALQCTGLDAALFSGKKTIYAPTDAAFAKLGLNAHNICTSFDQATLTNILLYHVADGKVDHRDVGCVKPLNGDVSQLTYDAHKYFINEANIFAKFRQHGHGYNLTVYAISSVLLPPSATIVETAAEASDFSALVAAVMAADPAVATALSDEAAIWTIFAPTNKAFANLVQALGAKDLNDLVATIGVDALTTVLLYHVVDGCAFSNDLSNGQHFTTLQGEQIQVNLTNLSILDKTSMPAPLVPAGLDVLTANGIVHTIDKVLLPQAILDALN